jgi:hypothetical protein
MSIRRTIYFKDTTGYRTDITPSIVRWVLLAGGSAGTPPTLHQLLDESDEPTEFFYFDYDVAAPVLCIVDSGDTDMDPQYRYWEMILTPDDERVSIIDSSTGIYGVTVVTQEEDGTRIPDVTVGVYNSLGARVRTLVTGPTGERTISMQPATYTFKPIKVGVDIDDVTVAIAGSQTVTISGLLVSGSQPAAGCQTIWYLPDDPSLVLDETSSLTATAVTPNQFVGNAVLTGKPKSAAKINGQYEIQLAKTGVFLLVGRTGVVEWLRLRVTVTEDDRRSLKLYGAA